MSQQFHAIYENGVFRPLTPVSLPEQTEVRVVVDVSKPVDSEAKAESQRLARKKLFAALDQLPQHRNNDGWSAKDHDEILYGWKK